MLLAFRLGRMIDSSIVIAVGFMLSADTVLQARYRIVRQLGQGGMGAVYEAVDERLDTIVALKETLFADEKLRKQFEREARLLARMHHQALTRVSDHFNEGDGQFLVMQYIAGDDLAAMLAQRNSPFPQEEVLVWADQLCDALDYLHTQDPQIIHRDIKPQNLKLTTRGQVVLLDFGLAKGSAGQMSVVTTSASIFGYTPNYAPLEQIQGFGTDQRSDIYALSATLYHLMTNTKPPDALSRASAIVNGLPDPLIPANRVNAQVSVAVAAVLNKGMSQKRDDRFETANAMREALRLASERPLSEAATVLFGGAAADANTATVSAKQPTKLASDQTKPMGSEARTLIAKEATNVRQPASIATAVRSASGAKGSRTWLGAALLLALIAGGAGGFYVYRARHQSQQSANPTAPNPTADSPGQPSDTNQPANGSPVTSVQADPAKANESKAEKDAETSKRTASSKQPAAKTETKPTNEQSGLPPSSAHDAERNTGRNDNPNPGSSPQNPPPVPNPPGRQPGHPPGEVKVLRNGTRIVTGPDGTRIMTQPDGTRIVTQPDGTRIVTLPGGGTRIIPPGQNRGPKKRGP
jgi:serine/threonine protein kinase